MADIADLDASQGSWGTWSHTLKHPFQWKGVDYSEIELRIPAGIDMQAYYKDKESGTVSFMMGLVILDPSIAQQVFNVMNAEDWSAIFKKVLDFFPPTQ